MSKDIVFITGYHPFYQGGAEYQAMLLANQLKHKKNVHFLYRDHWAKEKSGEHNGFVLWPINPFNIKGLGKSYLFEASRLLKILQAIRPSAIYIRGANAYLGISAYYAKKKSCRVIWHVASDREVIPYTRTSFPISLPDIIDKKAYEYGLKRADIIITQTDHQAELLKKNYRRNPKCVIGNWHPVPEENEKKDNKNIKVLWIANWKPVKQPEYFVQLAKELSGIPNVSFSMVGRIGRYSNLAEEAEKAGIHVLGEVPSEKANQLLQEGHILVNTSELEGFSNTFIQAWLRNVPVVSLLVDPDNVLQRKKIGFCSKKFSLLVKNTKELITDASLRKEMGAAARAHALKNHSLKNTNKLTDFILE